MNRRVAPPVSFAPRGARLLLVLAGALWACGESSSRDAAPDAGGESRSDEAVGCPCSAELDNAFRAAVWGLSEGEIRLRVIEWFVGPLALEFDDEVVADWDAQLPCGGGCVELRLNQQVLAFYEPSPPRLPECAERARCERLCACGPDCPDAASEALGEPSSSVDEACRLQCLEATGGSCPPAPAFDEKVGVARVVAWSSPVQLAVTSAAAIEVPRDEVMDLFGGLEACQARFGDASRLGGEPLPSCSASGD
jgi:hypothetical protein